MLDLAQEAVRLAAALGCWPRRNETLNVRKVLPPALLLQQFCFTFLVAQFSVTSIQVHGLSKLKLHVYNS